MKDFDGRVKLLVQIAIMLSVSGFTMLFLRIILAKPTYKMGISVATMDIERLEKRFEKRK